MRTIALAALAAIAPLLAPGCSLIVSPIVPDVTGNDAGEIEDGDAPDAPDADTSDADMPDTGFDAWLADAGDADVSEDTGVIDTGFDAGMPDTGLPDSDLPDVGPTDAGDAGPTSGCADGTDDQTYPGTRDMVGCDGARTQCLAETLCDSGWHLCTFAEYQTRGGMSILSANRWLAACVRTGCGSTTMPTGDVCASCAATLGASVDVRTHCATLVPESSPACEVGVLSDGNPDGWHVGAAGTPCSRAYTAGTYTEYGAACCR